MCTEYAALASNILSVFGFNTLFTIGSVDGIGHNYNIISYKNDECGILDLAFAVDVYSLKGDFLRYDPYFKIIEATDEEFSTFLEGEIDIEMPDYCIVETSDRFKKEVYFESGKRVYNIDWVDTKKLDNEPKVLILQNDK